MNSAAIAISMVFPFVIILQLGVATCYKLLTKGKSEKPTANSRLIHAYAQRVNTSSHDSKSQPCMRNPQYINTNSNKPVWTSLSRSICIIAVVLLRCTGQMFSETTQQRQSPKTGHRSPMKLLDSRPGLQGS